MRKLRKHALFLKMGIDFVRKRPDSARIPVNEPHSPRKVLRPPETLPHTPRWFPGLPEMSRTVAGSFCDPPKPCRKLRAGFRGLPEMSRMVAGSLRELRKQALFELFQIITVR